MPTFVMLSTLGPDGSARLRDNPGRLREVRSEVEAMGVRVVQQYALLGNWDFLNINAADNVLHILTAVVGLMIALLPVRNAVEAGRAR